MTPRKPLMAPLLSDFYKQFHCAQYLPTTKTIYSTWTARCSRIEGVNEVVVFGYQGFVQKYLIDYFNDNFFSRPKDEVLREYDRFMQHTTGRGMENYHRFSALHDLGYLPLLIEAVPEGTLIPIRTPSLTITNTDPRFFWLTNFIETLFSCEVWQPTTSATIAREYRCILEKYAHKTCDDNGHVDFQAHDFSMRGMSSLETSMLSGAAHLLSFKGTDTIPAIDYLERYYGADIESEVVGTSIPATEHSVVCCNGADEYNTLKRLLTEVYPSGLFSYVSDTWNLWDVLTKTLPQLKDEILSRNGKLVIRPDSGNPVDIICGTHANLMVEEGKLFTEDKNYLITNTPSPYFEQEKKGVIELLWDLFGGTINSKGYKVLDEHIGAIYGDAITVGRAEEICAKLESRGFASSNIVFGVGSFTYNYNTRDTFGHALKSTYAVDDKGEKFLFKDPITDNGVKKSQKGLVLVYEEEEGRVLYLDELTEGEYQATIEELEENPNCNSLLQPIFCDGKALNFQTMQQIRHRIQCGVPNLAPVAASKRNA